MRITAGILSSIEGVQAGPLPEKPLIGEQKMSCNVRLGEGPNEAFLMRRPKGPNEGIVPSILRILLSLNKGA